MCSDSLKCERIYYGKVEDSYRVCSQTEFLGRMLNFCKKYVSRSGCAAHRVPVCEKLIRHGVWQFERVKIALFGMSTKLNF